MTSPRRCDANLVRFRETTVQVGLPVTTAHDVFDASTHRRSSRATAHRFATFARAVLITTRRALIVMKARDTAINRRSNATGFTRPIDTLARRRATTKTISALGIARAADGADRSIDVRITGAARSARCLPNASVLPCANVIIGYAVTATHANVVGITTSVNSSNAVAKAQTVLAFTKFTGSTIAIRRTRGSAHGDSVFTAGGGVVTIETIACEITTRLSGRTEPSPANNSFTHGGIAHFTGCNIRYRTSTPTCQNQTSEYPLQRIVQRIQNHRPSARSKVQS